METETKTEVAEAPRRLKLSIHEALPLVTGDVRAVGKNNKNKDQGYAFRGIDAVVEEIHPIVARYGVSIVPRVESIEQTEVHSKSGARGWHTIVRMSYKFTAADGTSEIGSGAGEAISYDDKGVPKAQAMAFKYYLTQAFTIPTNEMLDTEVETQQAIARTPEPIKGARSAHDEEDPFMKGTYEQHRDAPANGIQALPPRKYSVQQPRTKVAVATGDDIPF